MKKNQPKKGVTLLFAVIISSAALTVGLSVYSLLSGQIRLSAIERDSLQALYANDAGIECVLFWLNDPIYDAFSSTSPKLITCDEVVFDFGDDLQSPPGPDCEDPTGLVHSCDTDPAGFGYIGYKLRDSVSPEGHQYFPNTCTTVYVQPESTGIPFSIHAFGQSSACGSISPNTLQRGTDVRF